MQLDRSVSDQWAWHAAEPITVGVSVFSCYACFDSAMAHYTDRFVKVVLAGSIAKLLKIAVKFLCR